MEEPRPPKAELPSAKKKRPARVRPSRDAEPEDAGSDAGTDGGEPDGGELDGGVFTDSRLTDAGMLHGALLPDAGFFTFVEPVEDAGVPAPAPAVTATRLPPATPSPVVAPLFDEPTPQPEASPVVAPPQQRPLLVAKTILGLVVLLALAYLGGHPRVQRVERTLRISQVVTAGLPYLLLGALASLPGVDILSGEVLTEISPVLRFGLGLLGFAIGFRFDARLLGGLPEGTPALVVLGTALPFATVVAFSSLVLFGTTGYSAVSLSDPVFLRDAIILGCAGAVTAGTATLFLPRGPDLAAAVERVTRVVKLEELFGLAGLAIVGAFFRPQGAAVTWQLPGTAWLLLTFGLGAAVGVLVYGMLQRASEGPEFLVITLGSIAFAAGLAGYLLLSSVVVCFFAGVLLVNFPGAYKDALKQVLKKLERPVYLMFLVVVGALVHASSWIGLLLILVFVPARLLGKWLGNQLALRSGRVEMGPVERKALVIAPIGPLAVGIVVNAHLLYPGGSIANIMTAVVGGALLTEGLMQFLFRARPANGTSTQGGQP